jgi:hypothetical protein
VLSASTAGGGSNRWVLICPVANVRLLGLEGVSLAQDRKVQPV